VGLYTMLECASCRSSSLFCGCSVARGVICAVRACRKHEARSAAASSDLRAVAKKRRPAGPPSVFDRLDSKICTTFLYTNT
jgi:hypothetical protein